MKALEQQDLNHFMTNELIKMRYLHKHHHLPQPRQESKRMTSFLDSYLSGSITLKSQKPSRSLNAGSKC